MPNMWKKVPSWLLDPLGPLTIRARYLPRVAPWLVRMLRHPTPREDARIATALQTLLRPIFDCYGPLLDRANAGALGAARAACMSIPREKRRTSGNGAWRCAQSLGVNLIHVERDELGELEPDLKGRFRFGILAPTTAHAGPVATGQGPGRTKPARRRAP